MTLVSLVCWAVYSSPLCRADPLHEATSKAEMDALLRLLRDKEGSCGFYKVITGEELEGAPHSSATNSGADTDADAQSPSWDKLNDSQKEAVRSCTADLSLIWGPPGQSISIDSDASIDQRYRNWENYRRG